MKLIVLLGLVLSGLVHADFVYMQENAEGKAVMLKSGDRSQALNDLSTKAWAIYPDITPDGSEIVYVEGPNGMDLHITYQNLGKNVLQRFHHAQKGMLLHPKFTKNGKMIFYTAPGKNGKNTIYFFNREVEVNRQGIALTDFTLENAQALDESEESYFPRPSSDGNFITYQRNVSGKREVIFFDRLENKKTVIAEGMSPALSFDELKILFTSKKDGNWNIYQYDRLSKVITQLTSDAGDEQAPTYMHDNSVVFASNKGGHYRLYKLVNQQWEKLNVANEAAGTDFYSPNFSGDTSYKQGLKASFIGNPRSSFGTALQDGKLYMAGGHQGKEHTYPPESFTDTFLVYDVAINKWTELAPRPAKAHGFQIIAHGNYVYAFGGFAYSPDHKPKWKSLAQIDRYHIKENKWETIGQMNEPRSSNVAVKIDNKVFLAAGWNSTPKFDNDMNGKFHDTIEIFDLISEKIEIAPYKIPSPVRRALTGVELDGKIVLIGGLGEGASHFELLDKVTAINPDDGTSKELPPLPFATFAPAAEFVNGKLFVFGGMFKTGPMNYEYVSHIYAYDKEWMHTGRCLKETKGFSQVFPMSDNSVGILGGHHYEQGDDTPVSTFETFEVK